MKTLFFAALVAAASSIGSAEERLIPFDSFFVSVEPNDHFKPNKKGGSSLRVSLSVSRSPEASAGSTDLDVCCFDLHHSQDRFPEDDLRVLMKAGEAAKAGREFKEEVETRTFHGTIKSIYEVLHKDGGSKIVVNRGGEKIELASVEADRVRDALAEARVGEAWFTKLLGMAPLPQPNPDARPPRAGKYYLSSTLGIVEGRGIDYEVSVGASSFTGKPHYSVEHCIRFQTQKGGGSCHGGWVESLLRKVTEALQAVEKGTKYSFTSGNAERKYLVSANLDTKEADVTFYPGEFFGKEGAKHGHFGQGQLVQIRKLLDGYEARKTWFQEHEGWFFASTDEIAEQAGAVQPATRPESDSEGRDKPQPESEGRSR
jgi:hypothetical protein